MKRFTLFVVLMCMAALTFGQVAKRGYDSPLRDKAADNQTYSTNSVKGSGDLIWNCTFNWKNDAEPRGWSLPEGWVIKDNADLGNAWVWRNDTIKGNYTTVAPPSFFKTRDDGFVAVPIDEYNSRDGVTTTSPADTYIQTPKINCSAVSSVVVKFTQYFRLCCSDYNIEMLVTNDEGVHWATYDVRYAIAGNTFTPERFRNVEINISDVAAGLPGVQIRIYFHGPHYYFYMIDDLSLSEAFDNDLILEDYWIGWDGGFGTTEGHINYWPLSQMGMPGATSGTVGNNWFWSAFLNNGKNDQENAKLKVDIMKNGSIIKTDYSPASTIWTLERDSLEVTDPYLATDYGDYRFVYTAVSDNSEEVPVNNSITLPFTVNDTLGHRADFTAESSANTGGWVGGSNAGDMVGVSYDLYAPCEINSLTAYLTSFSASQSPQFQFVMLKDVEGAYEEWITTDVKDMDSTTSYKWVTLPVVKDGETEFLQPGNYAVCVRMWGTDPADPTNGSNGLSVGWDMTTKAYGTLMYQAVGGNWYSTGKLNMIGFNINATGAPTQAPVTFNVDMNRHITNGEFIPGTDKVDVHGVAETWNGTADMTDPEGDGIYTVTVDGMPVAKVLEFKYRINGLEEAYAFSGGPYRKYTVRYWNILNHIYNNGVTTGVRTDNLTASFNVYPNPTSGKFTVDISNPFASDLIINLIDTQGHVVYNKTVKGVVEYQETIDNRLPKGLYFLTVNNGSKVRVQKVVVR